MIGTGMHGWSAASDTNLADHMQLPGIVKEVIIFVDNGKPGVKAAHETAWRWQRDGIHTRVADPPEGYSDFNDLLMGVKQ